MKNKPEFIIKKRGSLRRGLLIRLILFWILPVLLIVSFVGIYVSNTTNEKTRTMIETSSSNALDILEGRINTAIDASLEASYKPVLRDAWREYRRNSDYITFSSTSLAFLTDQYKYDEKFYFTALTLTDKPDYRFHITNSRPFVDIMFYWQNVHPRVLELCKTLDTRIAFIEQDGRLYLVRNLMDENYYPYAILTMELNPKTLAESLSGITWATDITFWLNDAQITIMGDTLEWNDQAENNDEATFHDSSSPITVSGMRTKDRYNLKYSILADPSIIAGQINNTRLTIVLLCLLLVPLIISFLRYVYTQITKPVDSLVVAAHEVEQGNFGFEVDSEIVESSEMNYLSETFNAMSLTLKNQFERIYKEELALKDAQIMALQSQINPHFLNNTLEIVNWEARLSGNVKVCKMLEALSTMLNAAMDRKKRPTIHLSEELMYVDSYLYIIRERLGKRLTVAKEISDDVLDCYVPRLVLQPIIENAVEHGITPLQKGTITIRAYQKDELLFLEIENDGKASEKDLARIKELLSNDASLEKEDRTSLGIRNVNKRLKILYGHKSGLSIIATDNNTTIARICLAVQQDAQF